MSPAAVAAGSAAFAIGFLSVLANSHPGIGLTKLLTAIGWLISCCAVVFLW